MTTSDGTESGTPDEPIEIGDSSDVAAPRGDGIDVGGKAVAWGQRRPRSRVTPKSRWRLIVLQVLVVSLVATLLGRLAWMQMDGGSKAAAAVDARVRDIAIPAPRGLVVDQAGRIMAMNQPATDVLVDRAALRGQEDGGVATIQTISALTGTPAEDIMLRMVDCGQPQARDDCFTGGPYEPVPVVLDTQVDKVMDLIENPDKYPGITVRTRAVRNYDIEVGANASHLIGYLGSPTQEEVAADPTLHAGSQVGRGGIEAAYDAYLRGKDGIQRIALDRTGVTGTTVSESTPVAGGSVVSTIDLKLQDTVEKELLAGMEASRLKGYPADSGVAIVMDVTNGDILAMASMPTFDRKVFSGGLTTAEYDQLNSGDTPMLDRAIQGELAPASTFKVVTSAAAAKAGYDFNELYPCPSAYQAGNNSYSNYESGAYGNLTIENALVLSCNTVFYKFAAEMYAADGGLEPKGQPKEILTNTAKNFGFGSKTGIDLPGESAGRVVDRERKVSDYQELSQAYCDRAKNGYPEETDPKKADLYQQYAAEYCRDGMKYRMGDAINFSVGQGDSVVTPLQLTDAYAAIANGGTLWVPHVAKAVVSADGQVVKDVQPEVRGKLDIAPQTLSYIQNALQGVTTRGTAAPAFAGFPLDQIPVAAKTGTAEVVNKQTTSLFASYAPANNPKYAVVVAVTQAGVGAEVSTPIARKIYEAIFGIKDGKVEPAQSVLVGGAPKTDLPTIVGTK